MPSSRLDIRRSDERFHTQAGWLDDSKHSFSFSRHYDPDKTNHGQLVVLRDDRVAGGTGFEYAHIHGSSIYFRGPDR